MAAATPLRGDSKDTESIADPPPAPQVTYGIPSMPASTLILPASFLGRTFDELLGTSMINSPIGITVMQQASPLTPGHPPDITQILSKFSVMLANGLANCSTNN